MQKREWGKETADREKMLSLGKFGTESSFDSEYLSKIGEKKSKKMPR